MASLEEIKIKLSRQYIGQDGVHGLGISKAKNAVRVYVHRAPNSERVIQKIRDAAKPYNVIVQTELPPTITAG